MIQEYIKNKSTAESFNVSSEYIEGAGMFYEFNPADKIGYLMTMSNWTLAIQEIAIETDNLKEAGV